MTEIPEEVRRRVLAYLPEGHKNAVPGSELAKLTGLPYRVVQASIGALIDLDGVAIGSLCGQRSGFYRMRPGNTEDFSRGVSHIARRASTMFARIRSLEAIRRNEFPGTSPLPGLEETA